MAGAVDARQPHAAGDDFAEAGGLVAEPEQRLAGFQFAVDGRGAHRGGEPILDRHDLPHRNSLTRPFYTPIQLSNSQVSFKRASSPVFFAAPGTPSSNRLSPGLLLPLEQCEGVERQAAHQSSVLPHPLVEGCGRLSALHGGVLLPAPGRAFGVRLRRAFRLFGASPSSGGRASEPRAGRSGPPSASSSRAARSGRRAEPRRRPGAGGTFHPPPAGAASHPAVH